jgi:hypothetical protein
MKMLTTIVILLMTFELLAPESKTAVIIEGEAVMPYEAIITAIVKVESNGNTFAYNAKEGATGAFQIRQIRLDEYNRLSGENLKLTDCYNYEISKRIFLYYSCQFRYDDYKAIAWDWNKSRTNKYFLKVQKAML